MKNDKSFSFHVFLRAISQAWGREREREGGNEEIISCMLWKNWMNDFSQKVQNKCFSFFLLVSGKEREIWKNIFHKNDIFWLFFNFFHQIWTNIPEINNTLDYITKTKSKLLPKIHKNSEIKKNVQFFFVLFNIFWYPTLLHLQY